MATAFIDPVLPWLAIQNQNHSYGRKSRPGSAQRYLRIWNQPSTTCTRKSITVPSFYKGSHDPSLSGVDSKIRLNPMGNRPKSSSSAGRRRLVPAVVGFEEDDRPPSSPEQAWQKNFEDSHSKRGDENGSETSYVNFVRSYQGSSSRSSIASNVKPQQAWGSDTSNNGQKKHKGNVKVPVCSQVPSNTPRRDSRDESNYNISSTVLPRGILDADKSDIPTSNDELNIPKITEPRRRVTTREVVVNLRRMHGSKEVATLLGDTLEEGVIAPALTSPPEEKANQMIEEGVVPMVTMFDRSTQMGSHSSTTLERSYETAVEDRSHISRCDKGCQTVPTKLGKPPTQGDFFQKENREDALKHKVQSKLNRKQRKTSTSNSVDLAQPKFKEIPDFNMANWVQSRILVSAQSARYELPMDMHVLSKLSPLEYITEYAIICKRRQALYKLIFSKHDRERKHFLKRPQVIAGLKEIHLGSASDLEIASILKLINLEDNFKIDFRFFCSIAAFSERVLARWMILPGGAMTEKETIEKADFTNLTWKLEGVDITNHMQKVLYAL